jgi:hypothetical protein
MPVRLPADVTQTAGAAASRRHADGRCRCRPPPRERRERRESRSAQARLIFGTQGRHPHSLRVAGRPKQFGKTPKIGESAARIQDRAPALVDL